MAVMEGPLEPSLTVSTAADVPEDSSSVNFFSAAMNVTSNASNVPNSGEIYHASANVPLSSRAPSVILSLVPTLQVPSLLLCQHNQDLKSKRQNARGNSSNFITWKHLEKCSSAAIAVLDEPLSLFFYFLCPMLQGQA